MSKLKIVPESQLDALLSEQRENCAVPFSNLPTSLRVSYYKKILSAEVPTRVFETYYPPLPLIEKSFISLNLVPFLVGSLFGGIVTAGIISFLIG